MAMLNVRYVVVERAGYVGEKDVETFDTDREAWDHVNNHYEDWDREADNPHAALPDVRTDWTDEDGNEHSEYMG